MPDHKPNSGEPPFMNRVLNFRHFQDERDYQILQEINHSSHIADHDTTRVTLDAIAYALAHMDGLSPQQGVIIAFVGDQPIGYSRLGWYSSRPDIRLYYQVSFLRQECRGNGFWQDIVSHNENLLCEIAKGHGHIPGQFFQAWASDYQKDWISVLESTGFRAVRRFNNMLHDLKNIPVIPLPAGFDIRPVKPEHMRSIWDAQKEMNAGLFENVAEDWQDDKYPDWLDNPDNNPRFWQVAWSEDQIAGMVLARIDEEDHDKHSRKRGHTEHIYVCPQWRGHGLASALITNSLRVLKDHGMTVAELGVDSENESAAYRLYQKLGYETISIDRWFRKRMDLSIPSKHP